MYHWSHQHRHPVLLVGLLSIFIVPEILEKIFDIKLPFQALLIVLVLSSLLIIQTSPKKRTLSFLFMTALLLFLFFWNYYESNARMDRIAYLFLFVYFSFTTFYLFKDLLRTDKISPSVIIGAFAGYFLIGVIFFFILGYCDSYFPDTVNVELINQEGIEDMFYFSFITLTTIGYGDFAPTSELGQKIVILEGLTGQFYIAIVMAILVGKFLSHNDG